MRVRIVRSSGVGYWYGGRLGQEFEVVAICNGIQKYEVRIDSTNTGYVDFSDCEACSVPESRQFSASGQR